MIISLRHFLIIFILIFIFQSWTKADDIKDFEIEGISLGDSLLSYFNEEKINSSFQLKYKNNKYFKVEIYSEKFNNYDQVGFYIKTNDKNYEIQSISGTIFYQKNINDCITEKESIEKNISNLFNEVELNSGKFSPNFDNKTFYYQTSYWFKSGDTVSITCYDWSKRIEKEKDWSDNLSVELYTREVADFIINVTNQESF